MYIFSEMCMEIRESKVKHGSFKKKGSQQILHTPHYYWGPEKPCDRVASACRSGMYAYIGDDYHIEKYFHFYACMLQRLRIWFGYLVANPAAFCGACRKTFILSYIIHRMHCNHPSPDAVDRSSGSKRSLLSLERGIKSRNPPAVAKKFVKSQRLTFCSR